jgi:hypothetical protein
MDRYWSKTDDTADFKFDTVRSLVECRMNGQWHWRGE